jgi:S-adenosylmethionine-diacylglycerol 3-amino-3-carboxypropyl transferase
MKAKIPIEKRSSFEFVRYANCWEDASILVRALDVGPEKKFLSIASAGDNSLALLTLNPTRVVAVDLSRAQIASTELRTIAIRKLDYATFLWFLGYTGENGEGDRKKRIELYFELRDLFTTDTRVFWDGRRDQIVSGTIYHGKFERYFSIFRNIILPLVHGKGTVKELLREKDQISRNTFYCRKWNSFRWWLLFRLFFGRYLLGMIGRDPEFFRYVDGHVAERIFQRTRYALTVLPTHNNPYLQFILTGTFGTTLPFYAREENYKKIKENIGAFELFHGKIEDVLTDHGDTFDGFNLSDIFEYMDKALYKQTLKRIIAKSHTASRMAYWNMLVPRDAVLMFPDRLRKVQPITNDLFKSDQAFFYQAFNVDEVLQ